MLEVFKQFNNMASVEEENFLVIVFLLMKFGSMVLQEKIKHQLGKKEQSLEVFLEENKHDIFHLTLKTQCCRKHCMKECRHIPLPPSILTKMYKVNSVLESCKETIPDCCDCVLEPKSKSELDISEWDITLTSCILLEVFCLNIPDKISRIHRLRQLRNSQLTLHRGNAFMSCDNYISSFKDMSKTIKEIASTCDKSFYKKICHEIEELKNNRLCQKEINEAKEYWGIMMNDCMEAWKHDTETKNIESYSKFCIPKPGKYVEPEKAMAESISLLKELKFIIITGDAGSGKTTFCHLLMARMKEILHDIPANVLTECSDLKKIDFTNGCIIFIDDVVGKSDVDKEKFNRWSAVFDYIDKLRLNSNVYTIFSVRNCLWHLNKDNFLDYAMFKQRGSNNTPIVDLSGEKFKLKVREKINILKMFCKNFNKFLSEKCINMIANMDTPPGFPSLCEKFFSDDSNIKQGLNFFKNTSACEYYTKKVNKLLVTNQNLSYAVLISVFSKYTSYEKNKSFTFRNIVDNVDISLVKPEEIKPAKIKNCLEGQLKAFIDSSDNKYWLKHLVMYDAVILSYGENYPDHFLKVVSNKVLHDYARTESYVAKNNEVIVRFPCEMLASKLVKICMPTRMKTYSDTHKHPSFCEKDLVSCFLDIVRSEKESGAFFNSLMKDGVKNEINSIYTNRYIAFKFDEFFNGLESFEESFNNNDLDKLFITKFLDHFVAGSCKEKNDLLASETIKRFHDIYKFSIQVFEIVLQHDLIDTYKQFLKNKTFRNLFFSQLYNEKSNDNYFLQAFHFGARKCIIHMLENFFKIEAIKTGRNISEISKALLEKINLGENASKSLCFGNNWNDTLIIKAITCNNTSWSPKHPAVCFLKKK